MKKLSWVTNSPEGSYDPKTGLRTFDHGEPAQLEKDLVIGDPHPKTYTVKELKEMGYVGLYRRV